MHVIKIGDLYVGPNGLTPVQSEAIKIPNLTASPRSVRLRPRGTPPGTPYPNDLGADDTTFGRNT